MATATLTGFDKINLAHCAAKRAQQAYDFSGPCRSNEERSEVFQREHVTTRLWMDHRMSFALLADGSLHHYTQR